MGTGANAEVYHSKTVPFISSHYACVNFNNIIFLTVRVLIHIVGQKLRGILHTHEFAITIQHVEVHNFLVRCPGSVTRLPQNLEFASHSFPMVRHYPVNDPLLWLLTEPRDLDWQSPGESPVIVWDVWSQK